MIARVCRWKDLERWTSGGGATWDVAFPMVPLGEVLRLRREYVAGEHFNEYQPITIHFDGSIVPRQRTEPFKAGMFAAYPGELVYSKIDVRNGAIGLIPAEFDRVVVTSEYPVLTPDEKQVNARYLALLLRTPNFLYLLKEAASGTSGRKRVNAESFESLEIPLPELDEQTRLVSDYENALTNVADLEMRAEEIENLGLREFEAALGLMPPPNLPHRFLQIGQFRNMDRWSHEAILQREILGDDPPESHYEIVQLEEVATVTYGIQKSPSNRPGAHARPYLRVANVRRGRLDLSEIKYIDVPDSDMARLRLETGDVLFVEGNGNREELGRAAIWSGEIPDCVHQNHIIKARLDQRRADPEFIMEWFNTEAGRRHFFRNAKTTSGLGTLNSTDIRTAPVPLPDNLNVQRQIVRALREARRKAETLREEARQRRDAAWADFQTAIFQ